MITGDATAGLHAAQAMFDDAARRLSAPPAAPAPAWPQVDPENVQEVLGGAVLLVLSSTVYGASARAVAMQLHHESSLLDVWA
jgi:hypothetical protein